MEETVTAWAAGRRRTRFRALLLGVTPALAGMRWPEAASLLAIDNSLAMARGVWPGNVPGRSWAICGNWLALPRRNSSCDLVAGDGSMNCVRYPAGLRALAEEIRRVLREGGLFVVRAHARPETQEHPEAVFEEARRAVIPTFHQFKFRLLMALQRSAPEGISVDQVYRYWTALRASGWRPASRPGWEQADIDTIELYRDKRNIHTYPTLAEFRAVLHEYFTEVSVRVPSYDLGERCPILVLSPRAAC
jgi:SAM-dependent methyltransferase